MKHRIIAILSMLAGYLITSLACNINANPGITEEITVFILTVISWVTILEYENIVNDRRNVINKVCAIANLLVIFVLTIICTVLGGQSYFIYIVSFIVINIMQYIDNR